MATKTINETLDTSYFERKAIIEANLGKTVWPAIINAGLESYEKKIANQVPTITAK